MADARLRVFQATVGTAALHQRSETSGCIIYSVVLPRNNLTLRLPSSCVHSACVLRPRHPSDGRSVRNSARIPMFTVVSCLKYSSHNIIRTSPQYSLQNRVWLDLVNLYSLIIVRIIYVYFCKIHQTQPNVTYFTKSG